MKKVLSIMLSLLMVLSIIPMAAISVSAADYTVTTEEDFVKYIGGNGAADKVTLGADITVTTPIKNATGKADTLDLAGFTVTYAPADPETADAMISELNSTYDASTLNVTNSVAGQGGFVNESGLPLFATEGKGTVNFTTGEFYGDITAKIEGNNALTFKGAASVVNGKIDIDGNVNVSNTVTFAESVKCNSLNVSAAAVFSEDINVDGFYASKGTFNGNIVGTKYIKASGTNIVFNGTLSADTVALGAGTKAFQTVEANTFYALGGTYESDVTVKSEGTVIGGTFNGKIISGEIAEVVIAGGTLNAVEGNIVAKGGTFKFDPTSILGENATATEKSGTFAVANNSFEVNGVEYSSPSSAVSNAGSGDTIKLIDDYYVTSNYATVFTITNDNVTIDLNGKTITDLSDTGVFSGCNKFLYCNTAVTKFTLTDSTYATTGGGNVCIQGGGSNGGTEYCIAFRGLSGETPAELTFENCSFITNNSCWVNNGGAMQLSGGSTADNTVNFTNFVFKNTGAHYNTGQGYNGINLGIKATINADNFDYYAERNGLLCYSDNTVLNFKNSKFGYGRSVGINLNATAANTNCVVNAENTKFYNTTDWSGNIISIGTNTANTTQSFKNCEFELYQGSCISAQGNSNTVIIKDSVLKNTNEGGTFLLYSAGTDTVKVYNSQIKTPYYNSRIASVNAGSTLILDKNTTAVNTAAANSANASAAFYMKGTSADVKASLKVNHFTMSGYRNFVEANNAYADIYIEDFSMERDANAGQWNGGDKFVTNAKASVTLGEGYGVYEGDNEEATENFVWSASKYKVKKLKVFNPNLRIVTVDGESYKVNSGSEFTLPDYTYEDSLGYTADYETLYEPGDKVVINENTVFNTITKIITEEDFTVDLTDKVYSGSEIIPEVTSELTLDTDYTVSAEQNVDVGTATLYIKGTGKCFGTISKTFNIIAKDVEKSDFTFDLSDKTYTGESIEPEVASDVLTADDYNVVYTDNINVGTATITVTGKGNYKGQLTENFEITAKTIAEDDFDFDLNDKTYTRLEITPSVTAKKIADTDFEVVYSDNINKGTATITVTGKGNCKGEVVKTFNIVEKAIEESDFKFDLDEKVFTGEQIMPVVTADVLTANDFTVTYTENINVGEATITVDGKGNYEGQIIKHFNIVARELEDSDFIFDTDEKVFTGEAIEPNVTVNNQYITADDYDVAYTDNVNVGEATITVTGKGNFTGTLSKTFNITAKSLEEADFEKIADQIYANTKLEPVLTIASKYLTENDFEAVYTDNIDVGTATVTVTGKGNFKDEIKLTFEIQAKEITEADFTFDLSDKTYTRSEIEPSVTSDNLKLEDFAVTYENNINKGTAKIIVTGQINCQGTVEKEFEIVEKAIEETDFKFDLDEKVFTGEQIMPVVTADVLTANDFTVTYTENINVGEATITVDGKGNYKGQIIKHFNVVARELEDSDFTFDTDDKVFTGEAIEPNVTVNNQYITADDYDVAYTDNVNVGEATITVTGKGNFTGTLSKTFNITAKSLEEADFEKIADQIYANTELEPVLTIASKYLTENDFEAVYTDNLDVGTATVTVTGKGNFKDEIKLTFEIQQKEITENDFVIDQAAKTYTGAEIKPSVTSENLQDGDYAVAYEANINKGTAKIIVTGQNNCKGKIEKEFEIVEKAIEETDFKFDLDEKVFTGKAIEPTVTVNNKLITTNDYEVAYTNNVNAGTATITVTGKGNFTGTISKTFKIVPNKPIGPNKPNTVCNHKWTSKVVEKATVFKAGKKVMTCSLCKETKTVTIPMLKLKAKDLKIKSGSMSFKVTFKKVKGAKGYQVRFKLANSKKWTVKTFRTKKALKKSIKLVKSGKYKVQICALKKLGKKKVATKWTKAKTVTVKA